MRIRVSVISYLNTLPFVYGLNNHPVRDRIEMDFCVPSQGAEMLKRGETDLSIIPVIEIPNIPNNCIISDYCIGAEGKVLSVLLCSGKPLSQIDKIYLDMDSRSSVALAKILCKEYWKISPDYLNFSFTRDEIDRSSSYILIGDKALDLSHKFDFVMDLAEEWIKFKKLPFVFACWTANKSLDRDFVSEFNDALDFGVSHIREAVDSFDLLYDKEFAYSYLTQNISYNLTPDKRAGLSEFWSLAPEELKSKVRWFI